MKSTSSTSVNNILITGVKGKTGSRVFHKLKDMPGISLRGVSGSTDPAFDWQNTRTWKPALAGMDAAYITYQPDLAVPGAPEHIRKFVGFAVESGVRKVVLLSGRGEEEAQVCEKIIMNAGIDWTIVRASWFSQNFSEGHFMGPIQAGHLALPVGEVKEPFVDVDDIADVVVAALTKGGHSNRLYEVTGPRLITFGEAVEEIARATKREIIFEPVSVEVYTEMLTSYGVPPDYIALINYLFTEVLDGRNESLASGVLDALGREPKDFNEYVREAAATGLWNV